MKDLVVGALVGLVGLVLLGVALVVLVPAVEAVVVGGAAVSTLWALSTLWGVLAGVAGGVLVRRS